jgi:hypothetical protein
MKGNERERDGNPGTTIKEGLNSASRIFSRRRGARNKFGSEGPSRADNLGEVGKYDTSDTVEWPIGWRRGGHIGIPSPEDGPREKGGKGGIGTNSAPCL